MVETTPVVDTGQPPPGAGPPQGPSTTVADSPQKMPQSTEGAAPTPTAKTAADTGFHTPTTSDVFADTSSSQIGSPRSRAFDDSGDAIMTGDSDSARSAGPTFSSDLQTQADSAEKSSSASTKPTVPVAPQAPSTSPPAGERGDRATARRSRRAPRRTAPQQQGTPAATHSVWSPQGAAHIRATLSRAGKGSQGQPARTVPEPGSPLYEQYACATAPASLKRDGDQRAMTPLETETLHLWIQRRIHLAEPPLFLKETHTGDERDAFADYHRDHLGFRLYALLPVGIALSDANAKYHFCFTALHSAKSKDEHDRLLQLFRDALTTLCEPKSRIATLRFVHPEVRDSWQGFSFHLGPEKVTLTATDSLSSDVPRAGFDAGARKLLYHVFLRGHHRLGHSVIRAIGSEAARMPVLDVELVESIAASDYSPPKWKLTFDSIACPGALERVRRLEAKYMGDTLVFTVLHPRAARRIPCAKCLSVRHAVRDCDTRDPTASLKAHTRAISVPTAPVLPKITAAPADGDLAGLLDRLRQQAAPEVARRLAKEARDQQAETAQQAHRAAQARKQREQLHQARRAVARQLRALQLEYAAQPAPTLDTPGQQSDGNAGSAPSQGRTRSRAAVPSAPDTTRTRVKPTHRQGKAAEEPHRDVEMTDAQSTVATAQQRPTTDVKDETGSMHPAQSTTAAGTSNVAEQGPASGTPSADDRQASFATAKFPAESTGGTSADISVDTSSLGTSEASDKQDDTVGMSQSLVEMSVHQDSASALQDSSMTTSGSLALVDTSTASQPPGKRVTGPECTSSDEDDELTHVKKWSRWTTREDDVREAVKKLLPASPRPLLPAKWSPIQAAEQLYLTGPSLSSASPDAQPVDDAQADDAPVAAQGPSNSPAPEKQLKQLPLSVFYAPKSLAEVQQQMEADQASRRPQRSTDWTAAFPSPGLDDRLQRFRSPSTLAEWLMALDARVVVTPGTGGCLYFALHGTRTRSLTGATMSLCSTHVRESNYFKRQICLTLDKYLEPMLADGTVALTDFTRRCFPGGVPESREEAIDVIRQYYGGIRTASVRSLSKDQWGGDEELYAAIWLLRDPIFVISVALDSKTSVRVLWLDRPDPKGPEHIYHHLPSAGEAYEILRVFLSHRVTPMVLIHTVNHFNCLRFNEAFYKEWTSDDDSAAAMRDRLDQALTRLGWYVAPRDATDIPLQPGDCVSPPQPAASGSLYTPSESYSAEAALDADSTEPLSPMSHYALLRALNPRRRRRGPLAILWAQAEKLNYNAYVQWNGQQERPVDEDGLRSLETACRVWSRAPADLLTLLRSLPYPEVAISILPADIVLRLGNELITHADTTTMTLPPDLDDSEGRQLWATLVVLVTVVTDAADVAPLIHWLCQHPSETSEALHSIRLFDWTPIAGLARSCTSLSDPMRLAALATSPDRS